MTIRLPGNIVILDDKAKDAYALLESLKNSGHGVVSIAKSSDLDHLDLRNIRLIVSDLDLHATGDFGDADKMEVSSVLSKISSRSEFVLCYIWSVLADSVEAGNRLAESLKSYYLLHEGKPSPPIVGVGDKLPENSGKLFEYVAKYLNDNPSIGILYEWEGLLDEARDSMTGEMYELATHGLAGLARILHAEHKITEKDEKHWLPSAVRDLTQNLNQVLLYHMEKRREPLDLSAHLHQAAKQAVGEDGTQVCEQFGRLYSRMSYTVPKDNRVWTGNIYQTTRKDQSSEYALTVTPDCDLARNIPPSVEFAFGGVIGGKKEEIESQTNRFKSIPKEERGTSSHYVDYLTIKTMAANLYPLFFIPKGEEFVHVLMDLHTVEHLTKRSYGKWQLVARLSPRKAGQLQAQMAAYLGRIGVLDIPKEIRKLLGQQWKSELSP